MNRFIRYVKLSAKHHHWFLKLDNITSSQQLYDRLAAHDKECDGC